MFRVIAYDIADEKRRRKISDICLDYGVRQQYSVFVCDLAESDWERFLARITSVIDPANDSIHIFPICEKCREKQLILGKGKVFVKPDYYLF